MTRTAMAAWLGTGLALAPAAAARAATYEFLAAPAVDLNRVYRLDKATGEMGACQYAVPGETARPRDAAAGDDIGITRCYPPGKGASPQAQSEYALVASRHVKEGGVFRVDVRSGAMSICYVLEDAVVCTPSAR